MSAAGTLDRIGRAAELLERGSPAAALRMLPAASPRPLACEAAYLRGECLRALGFLARATTAYERALRAAPGEPDLAFECRLGLASVLRTLGRAKEARRVLSRCGSPQGEDAHRLALERALLARAEGRSRECLRLLRPLLGGRRAGGDRGFLLWASAGARRLVGDLAGSTRDFLRSRQACRRGADPRGEGYAMLGLGGVSRIRGRLAEARTWYSRALARFRKGEDLFALAYAHCGLANCLRQRGRIGAALAHYARSSRLYARLGDRVDLAYVDWGVGRIRLQRGELTRAEISLRTALKAFEKGGEARGVVLAELSLAAVLHARGRTAEAERRFARGLSLARKTGLKSHLEAYT